MYCAADVDATPLTGGSGGPVRSSFSLIHRFLFLIFCQVLARHLTSPVDPCFTREQILESRTDTRERLAGLAQRPAATSLGRLSAVAAAHGLGEEDKCLCRDAISLGREVRQVASTTSIAAGEIPIPNSFSRRLVAFNENL